ncbi:uncharacterized protein XM38_039140 [Halomicronema hongdechloris C2206]|uniref:NACHT domain-containing protein n=1 Tax=Halomicronema hongdechloris C2206 TaxID=1641165 RepID=A0A1Z3HRK4_9CYAN|nr:NACHT domain-containing protein [Halomicronema hongdechloris]ASC72954.1 uncharacterized protein XM38_039140 [Halomicronema hongdechloris C2206]
MVESSLLQLLPGRQPTAQDRQQLIRAVGQQVRLCQQSSLYRLQQMRRPQQSVVGVPGGARQRQGTPAASSPPEDLITLKFQIWSFRVTQQKTQVLSTIDEVVELFQRDDITGRLLILGEAGAGKTHTLWRMTAKLLQRAATTASPVPVLLDLADWQGEELLPWVQGQLWQQYRLPMTLSKVWMETHALTLMLDGFDALQGAQQRQCARVVETYMRSHWNQTVVFCCRRKILEQTGITLSEFNGGIHLRPLVAQQVKEYVMGVQRPELWKGIKASSVLQQLARFPLLLNCLVEAYDGQAIQKKQSALVQAYVERQLSRPIQSRHYGQGQHPNEATTRRYLSWLAQRMEHQGHTFYIDELRPALLPGTSGWVYRLLLGLCLALLVGSVSQQWLVGLAVGLMGSQVDVEAAPTYQLSLASLTGPAGLALGLRVVIPALVGALLLGGVGWLGAVRFGNPSAGFGIGGMLGGLLGAAGFLVLELKVGLQGIIQIRLQPNQDVMHGVRHGLGAWLLVAAVIVGIGAIAGLSPGALMASPTVRTGLALLLALALWSSYGLQHFLIRGLLCFSAQRPMPWNYRRFLGYATERRLLQQVGGGYRFVHDLVRQQFLPDPSSHRRLG